MKPWRLVLLVLLGLVLLTPTAGLYFVASTQAGLRFIAARLGKVGTVTITAEQLSGTLVDGFTVGSLRVQHKRVDIRITNARGQLRLMPLLLQRRIELSSAEVRQVTVQVFRIAGGGGSSRSLRFMPETFSVEADSLRADSVDLILMSGRTLHASNASAAAEVLTGVIRIREGRLDWNEMHIAANGRLHATQPIGLDGQAAIDWHPQGKPAWRFDTSFDGDLDRLPLELDIGKPFHGHVKGTATSLTSKWKLAGNGTTRDLDISVFGAGNALGILSAQVALTLDANGFSAKGPVTAPGLKAGPLQVDFHGAYANQQLTIRNSTVLHRESGSHATVHGIVDVLPQGPRLAIAGQWSTLQWPLVSTKPAFTSTQGQYTIDGLKPWKVSAAGAVTAAGLTDMPATLRGDLGTESITFEQATLGLFGGTADVKGEARWRPEESWTIAGHMSGLDPALLREDLPGRLDFDFRAAGAPFGEAGSIDFALSALTGKLRGQSATGSGRFTRAGGSPDWRFHQVDLRVGRARIQLDGSLNAPRDIRFAIDADDLSLLDQDARGRISARGRYAGTDAEPLLLFKARGTDFEWQGYSIDSLDADLDVDLGSAGHTQGKVDLAGIHYGGRTVQQASLGLSGTSKTQHFNLDVDVAPLRTALIAEGAMDGNLWRGNVQSLTVNDDGELALRLEKSAPLVFDMQRLELGDLCLTDAQARGCVSGGRDPDGGWNGTFSILQMPLRAFTAGLSQDVDYVGTINLRGTVAGTAGNLPTGSVDGELMQAQLLHTLSNKRVEPISLGSGTFQATATTAGFSAEVALDAGASGAIKGKLTGERKDSEWRDYPIRGELDARTDALSLLDIYVGDIDRASGKLNTSVAISGTLGNPVIAGQLQLRDASIDIYQSNTALRELSVTAQFNSRELSLKGGSRLGEGTASMPRMADFEGKLSWRDGEPYGSLHVGGENLRVINLPETRIDASPDLTFKIEGRRIDATGTVRIPWAKITSADLTGVVLPSDDESIVGAPKEDPQKRWSVASSITLVLGNNVEIDSLGLQANLGGSIRIRTTADSPITHGQGELNIRSGKFKAYGRSPLDIERGTLTFNGPVDNPNLVVRAQRVLPDDMTVGVNVRGPLKGPQRRTLFSEPATLTQSQITNILLGSGSLEALQDTERQGGARNEFIAQAAAIAGQPLVGRVGIDDIGVESDRNNDTSVVLGKQLSTRLYISYGISLAEAINTFKARWTIGKGWTLKTESGKARSADVVYTFKKAKKEKATEPQPAPTTVPKAP